MLNAYFDSVDEFNASTWINLGDITSVDPTFTVDGFLCILLIYNSRQYKVISKITSRESDIPL
jgi:hypothetical protein